MIEPLRLQLELDCPAEHAFGTWALRFGAWWPREHTVSGRSDIDVVLEPGVGGRIFERSPDGTETDWGEVTTWEPPRRLAYRWHMRRDRADATDVELVFTAVEPYRCRLAITHSGWERLGASGQDGRDANQADWGGLLPHYIEATSTPHQEAVHD